MADREVAYGETWVYESIVGAIPGVTLSAPAAIALQLVLFEGAVVVLAAVYGLWDAAVPGTVAVGVAAAGSVAMLKIGAMTRETPTPRAYRHLLFGSSIEVVLSLLAFIALVTYLFVVEPHRAPAPLFETLFGARPPAPVVYVTLLILWDLCYRIGTSWWTAVVSLWRSLRYRFDPTAARRLRRLDATNVAFGCLQLALVPFVRHDPVLLFAVGGHVVAVTGVSTAAFALIRERGGYSP